MKEADKCRKQVEWAAYIKSMGNSPQVKGFEDEESSTRRRGEARRRAADCALCLHRKPRRRMGSVYSRERGTARHKKKYIYLDLTTQGSIAPTLMLTYGSTDDARSCLNSYRERAEETDLNSTSIKRSNR